MSDLQTLIVDADQLRSMIDMRLEHDAVEDQELLQSIQEHGIKDALTCRYTDEQLPDGRPVYEIVDGRRRYRMGLEAGVLRFRITVEHMTDLQAYAIAFMKNNQRRSMSDVEESLWLKNMINRFELTQQKLGDLIGKTQGWVSQRVGTAALVETLPPEQRALIKTERQARVIKSMSEERQNEIMAHAQKTGALPSARELERMAKATKDPKDVLKQWQFQDDEFVRHVLMEECGLTLTEAGNMLKNFRLKKLPWQKRKKEISMDEVIRPPDGDPQAELYQKLGEWYPVNLLDALGMVAPAKSLPTWQRNSRRFVRRLIELTPVNIKTKILEEFMV